MRKKIVILIGCILGIGIGIGLFFSYFNDHVHLKAGNCLVTLYSVPRVFQVGEMQVALRLQDEQYRIVTDAKVSGRLVIGFKNETIPFEMETGPGRDYRGWVTIDKPGKVALEFEIKSNVDRPESKFSISSVGFPIVVKK